MKHFIINIMPTSIITKEEEISIYVQGTASNASSSRYTNNTVSKNLSLQLLNYSILTLNQKTTFPRCFSDEKKKKIRTTVIDSPFETKCKLFQK